MGHTEPAAGATGICSAMLRHETLRNTYRSHNFQFYFDGILASQFTQHALETILRYKSDQGHALNYALKYAHVCSMQHLHLMILGQALLRQVRHSVISPDGCVLYRLTQHLERPILHLSAINPYIASTLVAAGRSGQAHMPRMSSGSCGEGPVGISGFAFQGTNAHVITGRSVFGI